jgi:ribosomal protein L12E/L44/L45/RPP1/RPP2
MSNPVGLPEDSTRNLATLPDNEKPCVVKSGTSVRIDKNGNARLADGTKIKSLDNCEFEPNTSVVFDYGDKEKPKPVKEKPVVEKQAVQEQPVELPQEPTAPIVAIVDEKPIRIKTEAITLAQSVEKIPKKIENAPDVNVPVLVLAAVAAASVASVALGSVANAAKAKGRGKSDNKGNKNNNPEQEQREKEKEEQKKCNSKSDLVQSKIDQTKATIQKIEKILNKLDKSKQNSVHFDPDSFKKELSLLKKKIKKLEQRK